MVTNLPLVTVTPVTRRSASPELASGERLICCAEMPSRMTGARACTASTDSSVLLTGMAEACTTASPMPAEVSVSCRSMRTVWLIPRATPSTVCES